MTLCSHVVEKELFPEGRKDKSLKVDAQEMITFQGFRYL